jgi:hypothetical protein
MSREAGDVLATRNVQVASLAPGVGGELAAVVLCIAACCPAPGAGKHHTPKAGGFVAVTIGDGP